MWRCVLQIELAKMKGSRSTRAGWKWQGSIVAVINATGTINPITTVIVGSQLSGQVVEILADHNDEVKAGQIVARLNSDQIRYKLDAAKADIAQMKAAKVMQEVEAGQAERNHLRQKVLRPSGQRSDLRPCREQVRNFEGAAGGHRCANSTTRSRSAADRSRSSEQ